MHMCVQIHICVYMYAAVCVSLMATLEIAPQTPSSFAFFFFFLNLRQSLPNQELPVSTFLILGLQSFTTTLGFCDIGSETPTQIPKDARGAPH